MLRVEVGQGSCRADEGSFTPGSKEAGQLTAQSMPLQTEVWHSAVPRICQNRESELNRAHEKTLQACAKWRFTCSRIALLCCQGRVVDRLRKKAALLQAASLVLMLRALENQRVPQFKSCHAFKARAFEHAAAGGLC